MDFIFFLAHSIDLFILEISENYRKCSFAGSNRKTLPSIQRSEIPNPQRSSNSSKRNRACAITRTP